MLKKKSVLHPLDSKEQLEDFKQRSDMIKFVFEKGNSVV